MQVELIDDYIDITPKFRDIIYAHCLECTGNKLAPDFLNKQAITNLPYVNFSSATSMNSDIRTFYNLAWQQDIGVNVPFISQKCIYGEIPFDRILLN